MPLDNLTKELCDISFELTYKLRNRAEGFDENKYQELCSLVERLKIEWNNLDSIPKSAVYVLIGIIPQMYVYGNEYDEDLRKKINKAADHLLFLISAAVNSEDVNDYIYLKHKDE